MRPLQQRQKSSRSDQPRAIEWAIWACQVLNIESIYNCGQQHLSLPRWCVTPTHELLEIFTKLHCLLIFNRHKKVQGKHKQNSKKRSRVGINNACNGGNGTNNVRTSVEMNLNLSNIRYSKKKGKTTVFASIVHTYYRCCNKSKQKNCWKKKQTEEIRAAAIYLFLATAKISVWSSAMWHVASLCLNNKLHTHSNMHWDVEGIAGGSKNQSDGHKQNIENTFFISHFNKTVKRNVHRLRIKGEK